MHLIKKEQGQAEGEQGGDGCTLMLQVEGGDEWEVAAPGKDEEAWQALVSKTKDDPTIGTMDSSCQKSIVGLERWQYWEEMLMEHGIIEKPLPREECSLIFRCGNVNRIKAVYQVTVPIFIENMQAHVKVAVVSADTPTLISRHALSDQGFIIKFQNHTPSSDVLGIKDKAIHVRKGQYVLANG